MRLLACGSVGYEKGGRWCVRVWKIRDEIFLKYLFKRFLLTQSFNENWNTSNLFQCFKVTTSMDQCNVIVSSFQLQLLNENERTRRKQNDARMKRKAIIHKRSSINLSNLLQNHQYGNLTRGKRIPFRGHFSSPLSLTALGSDISLESNLSKLASGIVQSCRWTDKQRIIWDENSDETPRSSSRIAKIAATIKDTMLASLVLLYAL